MMEAVEATVITPNEDPLDGGSREEERFGTKMLRIDEYQVAADGAVTWESFYYGGSAIFSFRPTTEDIVKRHALYRSPRFAPTPALEDHSADYGIDDDDGADDHG
ncbi:hypothetical protein ACVSQ4_27385 [Klebsiella pneumoniae]